MTPGWKTDFTDQNTGADRAYHGPVRDEWLKFKPGGKALHGVGPGGSSEKLWRADVPGPISGGTLSTAGNLVFQGQSDGRLQAYRATDGKLLWEFDAGIGIMAPPMTYQVDGTQYIAVLAGWGGPELLSNRPAGKGKVGPGKLLSFSLGGTATLAPYERVVPPVLMPTFQLAASKPEIERGRVLFAQFCGRCHGGDVVSGGAVPDLRYASTSTHEMFEEIVRGGERAPLGMPSFAQDLTAPQVRLIHAYILDRARESARMAASAEVVYRVAFLETGGVGSHASPGGTSEGVFKGIPLTCHIPAQAQIRFHVRLT